MGAEKRIVALRPVQDILDDLEKDMVGTMAMWKAWPEKFCEDVLRMSPLEWQRKLMRAVALAKHGKPNDGDECKNQFSIKSGTGVGKTSGVACLMLWHLAMFDDSKVGLTAPTAPQIKAVMLPELRKWIYNIPEKLKEWFPFDAQTDRVMLHENFIVARTAREENSESVQGLHAKNMLMVFDEASGVPEAIYLASQGIASSENAVSILIGNPTRGTGHFFDSHNSMSHKYWTMTVSCADSEMVTPKYIQDMREKHGEDSYEFKVRVLGQFSVENSGIIIPIGWIQEAVDRNVEPEGDWIVWGVDVSDGRDKSAIAKRMANILLEPPKAWGGKELMQSVGIVVDEYYNSKRGQEPDEICVDVIGMGTGFAQRLRESLKGEPVKITGVNVALTGQAVGDRFTSRRVELWARGRAWFESAITKIPQGCGTLAAQLSSVEWEVKDSNGKWAIVDKKVGGHSPDVADAFLLTFGGVKGDKSSFTKKRTNSIIGRGNGAEEFGITSASYLQR
jgi:hypothetical protein